MSEVKIMSNSTATSSRSRPTPLILRILGFSFRLVGTIAPKFTACIAYRLWVSPPRFKLPATELDALKSARIKKQPINNKDITTFFWGDSGPIILLVHGWSGRGTQMGPLAKSLVKAGYRVLSFDAPAHGRSSGKQTNIYEVADTINGLDNLYGPFTAAITHSFGGPCLALAMKNGLHISRVVNISPPANTAGLVKKFSLALCIPEKAENALMRCIEAKFGKNVWQETSMQNNVRNLDLPAMVIHDTDDHDVPFHEGETIALAWSNAILIKTENLGHRRILRDPETIKKVVAFIIAGTGLNQTDQTLNAAA